MERGLTFEPSLALERTFLSYLRTSLTLVVLGIIVTQLFRLQHVVHPDQQLGYYKIAVPLGCTCIIAGIIILLAGASRFWRLQNALVRGKVLAGGWEVYLTWIIYTSVS